MRECSGRVNKRCSKFLLHLPSSRWTVAAASSRADDISALDNDENNEMNISSTSVTSMSAAGDSSCMLPCYQPDLLGAVPRRLPGWRIDYYCHATTTIHTTISMDHAAVFGFLSCGRIRLQNDEDDEPKF